MTKKKEKTKKLCIKPESRLPGGHLLIFSLSFLLIHTGRVQSAATRHTTFCIASCHGASLTTTILTRTKQTPIYQMLRFFTKLSLQITNCVHFFRLASRLHYITDIITRIIETSACDLPTFPSHPSSISSSSIQNPSESIHPPQNHQSP